MDRLLQSCILLYLIFTYHQNHLGHINFSYDYGYSFIILVLEMELKMLQCHKQILTSLSASNPVSKSTTIPRIVFTLKLLTRPAEQNVNSQCMGNAKSDYILINKCTDIYFTEHTKMSRNLLRHEDHHFLSYLLAEEPSSSRMHQKGEYIGCHYFLGKVNLKSNLDSNLLKVS